MARREYGEGSVFRYHAKDCEHRDDEQAKCGCPWRGTMDIGWNDRGKRKRKTVTAKTENAARRRLRDLKAERARAQNSATAADAGRKTIAAWSRTWLELREQSVRPKTHEHDLTAVRRYIVPTVGTRRLLDTSPADLRAVEAKVRREAGVSMAQRVHRAFVKLLRDAVAEGYAVPSTVFDAPVPGASHGRIKPKRDAMETVQAVAVLGHAADLPTGSRWYVGLFQGMRQGEALGLTWDCVDFDRHALDVSWQLQPLPYRVKFDRTSGFRVPLDFEARHLVGRFHLVRPKTAQGERVIPMVPTVEAALLRWRDLSPPNPHGLVWARENGWPIDKADDADQWRALQRAAGVAYGEGARPYFGHEMRNTTATLLAELGVDEAIITAILGHSSIATSRGYMRGRQPAMRAAMEQIEQAFTQPAALEAGG
jgi:integrase